MSTNQYDHPTSLWIKLLFKYLNGILMDFYMLLRLLATTENGFKKKQHIYVII